MRPTWKTSLVTTVLPKIPRHKCSRQGHFAKGFPLIPKYSQTGQPEKGMKRKTMKGQMRKKSFSLVRSRTKRVYIFTNKKTINFKLDSGVDVTIIGGSVYSCFFSNVTLEKSCRKLHGPCKSLFHCSRVMKAKLQKILYQGY